jgi:hypothetical protein
MNQIKYGLNKSYLNIKRQTIDLKLIYNLKKDYKIKIKQSYPLMKKINW